MFGESIFPFALRSIINSCGLVVFSVVILPGIILNFVIFEESGVSFALRSIINSCGLVAFAGFQLPGII